MIYINEVIIEINIMALLNIPLLKIYIRYGINTNNKMGYLKE